MIEDQFQLPPPAILPKTDVVLPNFIIGDEAFALKPYSTAQSVHDNSKAIYINRHIWARRTTENAFEIMALFFRIFHTSISVLRTKAEKMIVVACILHNMMRTAKVPSRIEPTFGEVIDVKCPEANILRLTGLRGRSTNGMMYRDSSKNFFRWCLRMIRFISHTHCLVLYAEQSPHTHTHRRAKMYIVKR